MPQSPEEKRRKNALYMRRWREAHPEEKRERDRRWREAHPEQTVKAYVNYRAWAEEHPEEAKARTDANQRRWKERHPGEASRRTALWKKANPERRNANEARRHARKKNAPINDFTAEQWIAMKLFYDNRCAYCQKKFKKLTMDHVIPLSKGGAHTMSNIVPSCQSCNFHKHTSPPPVPTQIILLLPPQKEDTK